MLERMAVYPLSCHGLKFWVRRMEGSDTQQDITGGDAVKNLERVQKGQLLQVFVQRVEYRGNHYGLDFTHKT